jgi:ring-1,2-phenylacetyl-CoA epoxidase subunit PaaE
MMNMAQTCLENLAVDKTRIHREFFTAKLPEAKDDETESADKSAVDTTKSSNGEISKVTVIIDGKTHELKVESDETILEAGIDAGIDPPFACQEGICTTCKAKLKSGKVKMDEDEGLTDDEIDEGYILTCQSHPTTPGVVVEYE